MLNNNINCDGEWTLVVNKKKIKKNSNINKPNKNSNINKPIKNSYIKNSNINKFHINLQINKPKKYIRCWSSIVTDEVRTLTRKEKYIIKKETETNPNLNICCYCCDTWTISDIICRSFFGCDKCYCCIGDHYADSCKTYAIFYEYNKDYNYKYDKYFDDNKNDLYILLKNKEHNLI